MDGNYLNMDWQNGFEATLDARIVLTDTYIPMTPVPEGDFGRLVLEDTSKENFEIIRYSSKDAHGVFVETVNGGLRNEDGNSTGIHPRGARIRANITAQDLREFRAAAKAVQDSFATFSATNTDWRPLVTVPTVDTSYANGHHLLRYAAIDYTGILKAGTKLKLPRNGTVINKSAYLQSSLSQSFKKTSPAGHSFTDFTVEGNLKLPKYPATSGEFRLLNRDGASGLNGWATAIDDSGRFFAFYRNGSNYTLFRTEQSLKQGKHYHVAVAINVTTKVGIIYVDGEPWQLTTGENSTAVGLVHGTNDLNFGTTTTQMSDCYASEWRIWSGIRTQQQIIDNKDKALVGNEANLVALYHFNGDANDSTVNANHFSLINSPSVTSTDHAFSQTEYAVVLKSQKPAADTLVDVFVGSGRLPKETILATSYANADSPIGFPLSKNYWRISMVQNFQKLTGIGSFNTWTGTPLFMNLQMGKWLIGHQGHYEQSNTVAATVALRIMLEKDGFTIADTQKWWQAEGYIPTNLSAAGFDFSRSGREVDVDTTPTIYRIFGNVGAGGGSVGFYIATGYGGCEIYADCAYIK